MNDTNLRMLESSLGMTVGEAGVLEPIMTTRELSDGDYLISEGTADDSLHVLLAGKLEVVKKTGAGEIASLAVLREGDLAGELSFIDGEEHTVGLRALCDTKVISLARDDFATIVDDNPQLVFKLMSAVARSAHKIVRRMNSEFIELSNYIFKQHGRY